MNLSGRNGARDPALEARLARHLADSLAQGRVHAYRCLSSTMETAHQLAASGAEEGTLVWAARQSQGRGRFGRRFDSPEGGIYCSMLLRPSRPAAEVPQLSLVAGLATAETIRAATGRLPLVRWPNDILLNDRKVAGILLEAESGAVVLGIGINAATPEQELPAIATSLAAAGAADLDLHVLTGRLCRALTAWYLTWCREGFAPIRKALRPSMGLFGQIVHIRTGSTRLEGTASDLDESGRLVVRLDSGVMRSLEAGEVTQLS